jgi:2-amino-4-hydroxy-6-hydroxymethyldihydropteridine diphosphokinase
MKRVFLGIGTNLGDREANMKEAIAKIEEYIGRVLASSSVYETEPWGFKTGSDFLNIVLKVETELIPSGLLGRILMIESQFGRIRGEKKYSSRVIDIDILLYGDQVIDEESIKIPHPLMHERKFVLIPLCEIEPNMLHPVLKEPFSYLLQNCKDKSRVQKSRPQDLKTSSLQDN